MIHRLVSLASLMALALLSNPASSLGQQRFDHPQIAGVAVDWCLGWAADCGKPAADRFCRDHGSPEATDFAIAEDVGHTVIQSTGQGCDDPRCDSFAFIECRSAAPPPLGRRQPAPPETPPAEPAPPPSQPSEIPPAEAPVVEATELKPWTTQDVIDSRIDVQAQYALMRMFVGEPLERIVASHILSAVKDGSLGGIYQEDQQVPALRAQSLGYGWWQILPKPQGGVRIDGICMLEPADRSPILVMRRGAEKNPAAYDAALQNAWLSCGLPPSPVRPYRTTLPAKQPPAKVARCMAPSETTNLAVWVSANAAGTEGVPGTKVVIEREGYGDSRTTDGNGTAWFSGLPGGGVYLVIASGPTSAASTAVEVLAECHTFTAVTLPVAGEDGLDCEKLAEDKVKAVCTSAILPENEECNALYIQAVEACQGDELCLEHAEDDYQECLRPLRQHMNACEAAVRDEVATICQP